MTKQTVVFMPFRFGISAQLVYVFVTGRTHLGSADSMTVAIASRQSKDKNGVDYSISYFQVFRYATCWEAVATIIGVLSGLLSGAGVCYNLVQFGELSTAFVERTSNPERLSSFLPLTSLFGGGKRLQNASHEENMAALVEDAEAMAIGLFISIGISTLLCTMSVTLINWSALRQITRIRMLFLVAVLRQDMSWYDTNSEFNLASKMSENLMKLKEGMGEKMSVVCNLLGTAIICLISAFPLGWELTLACIAVVPFSIAVSVALTNYDTRSSIQEMEQYSKAGKQAEEVLKSIKTVVAFGGEQKEIDRYKALLEPAERFGRKRGLYSGLGNGLNWVLTFVLNAFGFAYGTRLVLTDFDKPLDERKYIVGVIFSILFNVYMGAQSITMCVPHLEAFATARGAAASIFQLIDRESSIDSLKDEGLAPRRVIGEITLEDIHFSYPARPDIKVLKGFSLTIKRGECVALVGPSGCGKSTILQLMQRLYDPHTGSVKLDGRDLKSLNLPWLRSCLGVVGQEPVLFRGTIHENIAIGYPHATREDVQRVAEMAYAHDFIRHLSNGYDTVIGERGASLSGGQKQRIAIARSLLRDPAVLLLDEATSALDPHSERQVQIALDRASIGRTTLTVSHRLSTIQNANRIICMDQGAIVEQGTYDELIKLNGFFYNLVKTSSGSNEAAIIEEMEEIQKGEEALSQRVDVKRRSARRLVRRHSRNETLDWIIPRNSISSVVSAGLQSFTNYGEMDSDDEVDDSEIKSISDWQILKLNAPEWMYIVVGSIAAIIQGACFPAFAIIFGYSSGIFIDPDHERVVNQADLYSGLLAVVAFIAGVSMFVQGTTFTSSGLKMTTRLRYEYFSALLRQEIGFYDKACNAVGAICARLSADAAEIQSATGSRLGIILQGISSLAIGVILAFTYNWKLTLVAVAFLPLMIGSIWFEGRMSRKSAEDERVAMETATTIATEAVISIKTVQSLGVESAFLKKFEDALSEACAAVAKQQRWRGLVFGLGVYVPFVAFVSAAIYGAILVSRDEMEYKIVLLVDESIMYGAYMLGHALVYAPSMSSAKVAAARILSVMQRVPVVRTEDGVVDKKKWVATGCFSVKAAEFSYPTRPHQRVLNGLSLSVEAGKTVALVGSSGCGKSTVLQLMQRFYDPDSGNIEMDGYDTRSALTLPRLRRQLGVVQQEPVLFDRTIGENIAYGDNTRKISTHEVIAAAKAANIHSFITSLPKGYDTNLGAGGAQLSGGQKQRVCIARALIRSPRLLLLDEATSALDANSERAVSEALEKAAKGRTCITIAHRLTTIKDADLICVVDKGTIVEKGTHTELINMNGHYWRMCHGQNMG